MEMSELNTNLTFFNDFIVRTPLFTFEGLLQGPHNLKEKLKNPLLQEAIWLASPSLFNEIEPYLNEEIKDCKKLDKIESSIYKYLTRAHTRATPFGLFASCSTGKWSNRTDITLKEKEFYRYVRLDNHYLSRLAKWIEQDKEILNSLLFFPNSSLYSTQGQFRYMAYTLEKDQRNYRIEGAKQDNHLQLALNKAVDGCNIYEIAHSLTSDKITLDEALDYVFELMQAQILVSELEPSAIQDDYLKAIIKVLKEVKGPKNASLICLSQVQNLLLQIQKLQKNTSAISHYKQISLLLGQLDVEHEAGKLFHVDIFRDKNDLSIDCKVQSQITETIQKLDSLNPKSPHRLIEEFKNALYKRHETSPQRLVDILDTDIGIGYPANILTGSVHNPLLKELAPDYSNKLSTPKIPWGKYEQLLLNELENKKPIIHLDKIEFASSKQSHNLPWAATQSCMFRIVSSKENDNLICLESFGGASASGLLGRFSCGNPSIHKITKQICDYESEYFKDAVVTEVCHIGNARVGNITYHKPFRKENIPFLNGKVNNSIKVADIIVQIVDDQLLLFNKNSGKAIVPRISNAHNYSSSNLPLYHFLGDYQYYMQKSGAYFDWGGVKNIRKQLPRVMFKNVIVNKAEWNFTKPDFEKLNLDNFNEWKKQWGIPDLFVLADGDNELFINCNQLLARKTFLSSIEKRSNITIIEFLFSTKSPAKNENGKIFSHQIVASLKTSNKTPLFSKKLSANSHFQRKFASGSNWHYYKLYSGKKTLDNILAGELLAVLNQYPSLWFFIRYADPDEHIRLRVNLNSLKNTALIDELNKLFNQLLQDGVLWKVQTDTYLREIERYGKSTMKQSEALFSADSKAIARILSFLEGDEGEEIRWRMGCFMMLQWLDAFNLNPEEKLNLLKQNSEGYRSEFGIHSKFQKKQLDTIYRTHAEFLEEVLTNCFDFPSDWNPLKVILDHRFISISKIAKAIKKNIASENKDFLTNFISSHIHMTINRLFAGEQRKHEMVLYDFLFKQFRSVYYRFHKKPKLNKTAN